MHGRSRASTQEHGREPRIYAEAPQEPRIYAGVRQEPRIYGSPSLLHILHEGHELAGHLLEIALLFGFVQYLLQPGTYGDVD